MDLIPTIIIFCICLVFEGFFSGSEMALVSSDKFKLAIATDAGSKRAHYALHMVKFPAKFFSTTLLGTNISTVTGSVVVALFIIKNYGPAYSPIALVAYPVMLIFGEIVPKSIYQHYADKIVLIVAPILYFFSIVFFPVVWILSKLTESLIGAFAKKGHEKPPISREELEVMIELGDHMASDLRLSERNMVSRIFDLEDKRVENIMTPLVDVIGLPVTSTWDDAVRVMDEYEFSRVPVYEGRVFNIVGVLDGVDLLFNDKNLPVRDLMSKACYVPEEMPLDDLLIDMKRKGRSMVIAVDEYGAATGVVTVEDLMEEIVGEIEDEHDEKESLYKRIGRHHYIVNGRMEIEHANEKFKLYIPEGEYETMAGFIIHRLEHIPNDGEHFIYRGFEYIVNSASERAVIEIEIKKRLTDE